MTSTMMEELAEWVSARVWHTLRSGHRVFLCGNGDSFLNAVHYQADWTGNVAWNEKIRPLFHVLGLNPGLLTAISNDSKYTYAFQHEFDLLASSEDLLIALSTSGESDNIICILDVAVDRGISAILITAHDYKPSPYDPWAVPLEKGEVLVLRMPHAETDEAEDDMFILGHLVRHQLTAYMKDYYESASAGSLCVAP